MPFCGVSGSALMAEAQARLARFPCLKALERELETRDAEMDECRDYLVAFRETLRATGARLEAREADLLAYKDANDATATRGTYVEAEADRASRRVFLDSRRCTSPPPSDEPKPVESEWSPALCLQRRRGHCCLRDAHSPEVEVPAPRSDWTAPLGLAAQRVTSKRRPAPVEPWALAARASPMPRGCRSTLR